MERGSRDDITSGGTRVLTPVDVARGRLQIPRVPEGVLQRSRLFDHLDRGISGPLTLVSAPAGAGKTVLVSVWAHRVQAQNPLAWVTLEVGDASRPRFWSSFSQGLGCCGLVVTPPPPRTGSEQFDDGYLDVISSAFSERTEPVVVVLDCEADISAAVAQDLDHVLRRSGGWLRLVVVTRVDPVLPLHLYRLAGTLVEVRKADLAFTLDEARELMTGAGVELSDAVLQSILDRTQGWAAGLRFAALSLSARLDQESAGLGFSGETGYVAQYLLAEVLDVQSASDRQLLLETSIVDVLRPGLIEALAGPHAQHALASLARGNAFLDELMDSPGCYRYQPLFHELLRATLIREMPARVPELHRAVAAWMSDQGLVEEAVQHSVAAGDWEHAARYLIDDLAIGRLLLPGVDALAGVLARLPEDTEGASASLVRAAMALAVFDVGACEEHLLLAEGQMDGSRVTSVSAEGLALQTVRLAHAASVANVERGLVAAAAAERLLQRQVTDRVDEHPELSALIHVNKGSAWMLKGHLDEAVDGFSAGVAAADRPGCEHLLINCLGQLALIAAMRGQLRKAVELSVRVADVQQKARIEPVEPPPSVHVALGWVNTELYDLPAARRHVLRAAESAAAGQDPTLRVMLALVDSRVRRAHGDVDGALARIVAVRSEFPEPTQWLQDVLCIEEAELNIATGHPSLAVQTVEGLSQPESPESALVLARAGLATHRTMEAWTTTYLSAGGSLTTRVGGLLVKATRHLEDGEELRAVQELERALRLAAPERLRRPFREASPQVRQLLREDHQLTSEHSWLGASTMDDAQLSPRPRRRGEPDLRGSKTAPSPLLEPLTPKELEVLGHLAELHTTDEIAGAMFVSVNTVRTHVRNILRKFAASRRNEAVRRARELGLIPGWTTAEPTDGAGPAQTSPAIFTRSG